MNHKYSLSMKSRASPRVKVENFKNPETLGRCRRDNKNQSGAEKQNPGTCCKTLTDVSTMVSICMIH